MKEHSREICYPGTHLAVEDGDDDDAGEVDDGGARSCHSLRRFRCTQTSSTSGKEGASAKHAEPPMMIASPSTTIDRRERRYASSAHAIEPMKPPSVLPPPKGHNDEHHFDLHVE